MARRWRLLVTVMNQEDWNNVIEMIMKTSKHWYIEDAKRLLDMEIAKKTTLFYDTDSLVELVRLTHALSKTRCNVRATTFLWNDYQNEEAES